MKGKKKFWHIISIVSFLYLRQFLGMNIKDKKQIVLHDHASRDLPKPVMLERNFEKDKESQLEYPQSGAEMDLELDEALLRSYQEELDNPDCPRWRISELEKLINSLKF